MASIDLHIHSIYSDGDTDIKGLYKLIKDHNIKTFSITDHDEFMGSKKMQELIKKKQDEDLNFITGIELTAKVDHGRMHILGYDFNPNNPSLNQVIRKKKKDDLYNFYLQLDLLKKYFNISFSQTLIDKVVNKVGNISRVDIAKLLIETNYATSIDEAFNKYLIVIMEEARKDKKGLTMEECVNLIKEAGGYVSLAHWNSYAKGKQQLYEIVKYLVSLGMTAIEKQHIHLNPSERKLTDEIINFFGLLETGGTDYHGISIKPNVEIGTGINGNVNIDNLTIVDDIKRKRMI